MRTELRERCTVKDFVTLDASSLEKKYVSLLDSISRMEPQLHVFEEDIRPDLIFAELKAQIIKFAGKTRPALFGVPVGVKGIYRTEGYHIRCGSLLPKTLFEGAEAEIVSNLKELGAVVLGITATSEFAGAEPAATVNPFDFAHTPGGSSSGSAAGVCAGFFPVALGTQTMGSITRPASYCGVYGFKPSQSSLSAEGVVPYSISVDQPGFFTSCVEDLKKVFTALQPLCRQSSSEIHSLRIGVVRGSYLSFFDKETLDWFNAINDLLTVRLGEISLIPIDPIEEPEEIIRNHKKMISYEAALFHKEYIKVYGHLYRNQTVSMIRSGQDVVPQMVNAARMSMSDLRRKVMQRMEEYNLDCIMTPATANSAPLGLSSTGDPASIIPWTHAGLPTIALPTPIYLNGMPQGLQLIGRFRDDVHLCVCSEFIAKLLSSDRD